MTSSRRNFLLTSAAATAMLPSIAFAAAPQAAAAPSTPDTPRNVLGPKPGYTPMVGTLVSMLTWMRPAVTGSVKGISTTDLDWLFDKNANSIGALLLHLAATETYYGMNTFEGVQWGKWSKDIAAKWDPAMELGDAGRSVIKGHPLSYYLDILAEVRAKSLAEFKSVTMPG